MSALAQVLAGPFAANDNTREPDLWHQIITGLRRVSPTFALLAIECRAQGYTPDRFADEAAAAIERLKLERQAVIIHRRRYTKCLTIRRRAQAVKRARKRAQAMAAGR